MKPPIALGVLKQPVVLLVIHAGLLILLLLAALELVPIDKVVTCVVRRIDVDHLHLAQVALLQEFEDFQIVTFNIEVLRGVPVPAILFRRAQRLGDGPGSLGHGGFFPNPGELIALIAIHYIPAEQLLEHLKVDPLFDLPVLVPHFRDGGGEELGDFVDVACS